MIEYTLETGPNCDYRSPSARDLVETAARSVDHLEVTESERLPGGSLGKETRESRRTTRAYDANQPSEPGSSPNPQVTPTLSAV
ncbi:hypothetical protein [Embleya sp. NPDC001921]